MLAGVPAYRLQALYFQGEKINNWFVGGIDRYLKPIETLQKKSVPDKRIILILVLKRNILCQTVSIPSISATTERVAKPDVSLAHGSCYPNQPQKWVNQALENTCAVPPMTTGDRKPKGSECET